MPVQDKAAVHMHRATGHHRCIPQPTLGGYLQVCHDFLDADFQRVIDDNAHRTVFVVFAQVGNAVREYGVGQAGHGEQEVVAQALALG